jgi:hypothetical protein
MNKPKKRGRPAKQIIEESVETDVLESVNDAAQSLAKRVWNGQSDTVPRVVRLERVRKALEGQGFTMDGVKL